MNASPEKSNVCFGKVIFYGSKSAEEEQGRLLERFLGIQVQAVANIFELKNLTQSEASFHALLVSFNPESMNEEACTDIINHARVLGVPTIVHGKDVGASTWVRFVNAGALFLLQNEIKIEDLKKCLQSVWNEPRGIRGIVERFYDLNSLTPKEKQIATLSLKGLSIDDMSKILGISVRTVKYHLTNIYSKCEVSSRAELLSAAIPY